MTLKDYGEMQKEKNFSLWRAEKKIEKAINELLINLREKGWKIPSSSLPLQVPRLREKGDFTSNLPYLISSLNSISLKEAGKLTQKKISLPENEITGEVEGGYFNFHLTLPYLHKVAEEILRNGENFPSLDLGENKKIQIEFVSANPTGPLHIGHGRGAALGQSLCNLLRKVGFNTESEYYVNNVGKQIKLLGESLSFRLKEKKDKSVNWDDEHYKGKYLKEIADKYYMELNDKEDDLNFLGKFASDILLERIKEDLKTFGVKINSYTFEDSLYKEGKIKETIDELKKKDAVYEKDGALWLASSRLGDEKDRVLVRKNGNPTYLASDVAYHREKFQKGYDEIINIWGADHHGYVKRLKAALEFLGLPKENLKVILVQMVSLIKGGKKIQLSTRGGEFVSLKELLGEVDSDVCHFIFLTRKPDTQLEFNIDLAKKEAPENPVYYVQYAHARISSIFRKSKRDENSLSPNWNLLKTHEEKEILRKIALYSWILEASALSLEPHRITNYLLELSTSFHKFYDTHKVLGIDKNLQEARLALCLITHKIISSGLKILGIEPRRRM